MTISRTARRAKMLIDQVRSGGKDEAMADLRRWANSETHAVGLRRVLEIEPDPPKSLVPLTAKPIDATTAPRIFDVEGLSPIDQLYLDRRQNMYDAGFRGGWCAVDPEGNPAYVQWLIPGADGPKVRAFFGDLFPPLDEDTLFIEGAWIPPMFRKQKVMSEGLALVTRAAADATPGSRFAVAFVTEDNRGAAFGTRAAGYDVFMKRTERWRMGRLTTTFGPATEDDFAIFAPREARLPS